MEDYRDADGAAEKPSYRRITSDDTGASWEFSGISEVAEEFGFTLRALRFYEEKGLISPRRSGHRRLYSPLDRRRLEVIAQGKRIGLALEEIREILRANGQGAPGSKRHLAVVLEKCLSRVDEIRDEQRALEGNLQEALLLIADLKERLGKSG